MLSVSFTIECAGGLRAAGLFDAQCVDGLVAAQRCRQNPALRLLEHGDFSLKKSRKRFSDMKILMTALEEKAQGK